MTDNVKSTLVLGQNSKKDEEKGSGSAKEIEYKQVANLNDFVGELSDEEKEAEFNKQHE
jgi:ribosomal protein S18